MEPYWPSTSRSLYSSIVVGKQDRGHSNRTQDHLWYCVVGRKPQALRNRDPGCPPGRFSWQHFGATSWSSCKVLVYTKFARRKPGMTNGSCQKLPRPLLARCKGNAWLLAWAVLGYNSGVCSLPAGKGHFGIEGKQARTMALGN